MAATLRNWQRTDWGAAPQVHHDPAPERADEPWGTPARSRRVTEAFAAMLRTVIEEPGADDEWLLLLEDDLEFHPRIARLTLQWAGLRDPLCVLASLFNPSLRARTDAPVLPDAFAANPKSFSCAQALFLRRGAARRALEKWNDATGMQAQRLAAILGVEGPIWVHRPSLVQHVAENSSWAARRNRAPDFAPAWAPSHTDGEGLGHLLEGRTPAPGSIRFAG